MTPFPDGYFFAPECCERPTFVIRSYLPGDGPLLADAIRSSQGHLAPWLPWARTLQPPEAYERDARRFRAHYLLGEDFTLGIFSVDGRTLLGGSGYHLRQGPLPQRGCEIGMWMRADAAGRGLGGAVLRALLQWGFTEWPWARIAWRCVANNEASRRTAERAGMALEGVQRGYTLLDDGTRADMLLFSALRAEWKGSYD